MGSPEQDSHVASPVTAMGKGKKKSYARLALGGWTKRITDVVLAGIALVALLPLFILLYFAVRASSPGPALYGHERIGLRGNRFRCWKLRTMVTNGDAVLAAHLEANPEARKEWDENRKLTSDPRVTPLGHVLRKYSVDELPQLLNVLRGEMSFVGPRPVVDDELKRYGAQAQSYLSARPGITGLWQTSGRSDTSYETRVAMDDRYFHDWSFAEDIRILFRTIPVVLGARGSY